MGLFSGIGSFFSGIASAVSSFASSIGGVLGSICKSLCPYIGVVLTVGAILVEKVGKLLGVIEEKEKVEELGFKAEISNKKPEDYESFSEYIEDVRKIELTPEQKIKLENSEVKDKCKVIGTGILMEGISEKSGIDIPLGFWLGASKSGLSSEEVKEVLSTLKNLDKSLDLDKYFNKNLNRNEMKVGDKVLEDSFKSLNPNITEDQLDKRFENLQKEFKEF